MDVQSSPTAGRLVSVAELLGVCLGTRSKARRHRYRPQARRHVERFLMRAALGVSARAMAESEGYSRSNIFHSIRVGRELARANADALGLTAEDLMSE